MQYAKFSIEIFQRYPDLIKQLHHPVMKIMLALNHYEAAASSGGGVDLILIKVLIKHAGRFSIIYTNQAQIACVALLIFILHSLQILRRNEKVVKSAL